MTRELDLAAARAVAFAASPGPWVLDDCDRLEELVAEVGHHEICRKWETPPLPIDERDPLADARFIATFNPSLVVGILDELAERRHLDGVLSGLVEHMAAVLSADQVAVVIGGLEDLEAVGVLRSLAAPHLELGVTG